MKQNSEDQFDTSSGSENSMSSSISRGAVPPRTARRSRCTTRATKADALNERGTYVKRAQPPAKDPVASARGDTDPESLTKLIEVNLNHLLRGKIITLQESKGCVER